MFHPRLALWLAEEQAERKRCNEKRGGKGDQASQESRSSGWTGEPKIYPSQPGAWTGPALSRLARPSGKILKDQKSETLKTLLRQRRLPVVSMWRQAERSSAH